MNRAVWANKSQPLKRPRNDNQNNMVANATFTEALTPPSLVSSHKQYTCTHR